MKVKVKSKFVYSLFDCIKITPLISYPTDRYAHNPVQVVNATINSLFSAISDSQNKLNTIIEKFPEVFFNDSSHLNVIEDCRPLITYLFQDHLNDIVVVIESNTTPEDSYVLAKFGEMMYSLVNKLNACAPRYKSLLKLYKDKENKLLDGIKSTTTGETRFNDTPQNDGEFDDDRHNTNITKTKGDVVSDGLTPMQRLKEVQEAYRNLIEDWAKEFRMFFIAPSNYEVEEDE